MLWGVKKGERSTILTCQGLRMSPTNPARIGAQKCRTEESSSTLDVYQSFRPVLKSRPTGRKILKFALLIRCRLKGCSKGRRVQDLQDRASSKRSASLSGPHSPGLVIGAEYPFLSVQRTQILTGYIGVACGIEKPQETVMTRRHREKKLKRLVLFRGKKNEAC